MTNTDAHATHTHRRTSDIDAVCDRACAFAAERIASEPKGLSFGDAMQWVIDNPAAGVINANAKTEEWIMTSGSRAAQNRIMKRGLTADA
jgi:hypothetical protein